MSARINKLEALLARVQQRTTEPRPVREVAAAAPPALQVEREEAPITSVQSTSSLDSVPPTLEIEAAVEADEMSFADLTSKRPPAAEPEATPASLEDAMEQYTYAAPPASLDEADEPLEESGIAAVLEAVPGREPEEIDLGAPPESGDLEVDLGALKQETGGPALRPITLPDADDAPTVPPVEVTQQIPHVAPAANGDVAISRGEAPAARPRTFGELIAASLALKPRG